MFRDGSGRPNLSSGAGLKLELKDFAPDNLAEGISESFLIDSTMLCDFLNQAERKKQRMKQGQGRLQPEVPGIKKGHS